MNARLRKAIIRCPNQTATSPTSFLTNISINKLEDEFYKNLPSVGFNSPYKTVI